MSQGNRSFAARNQVVAISPQVVDGAAVSSSWMFAGDMLRITALILSGVLEATVDAKIEQAADSAGTGVKDIVGAALTQIAATGDNTFSSIDVETAKLDNAAGFCYVRLTITVASTSTGGLVAGILMGGVRHQPAVQVAAYAQKIELAG